MQTWDSYDEALAFALEQDEPLVVSGCWVGMTPKYFVVPPDTSDTRMWEISLEIKGGKPLSPEQRMVVADLFGTPA